MDLPENDHVMRHVPYKKLLKDEDGNPIGFLAQAFEMRPGEPGLSVNWLEYFKKNDHKGNAKESIHKFRRVLNINNNNAFAVAKVNDILETCHSCKAEKVKVVYKPSNKNKSHSAIIRLPYNDLEVMEGLATDAFKDIILNKNFT